MSFDRNVDLDKRFVQGEPPSLGRRSQMAKSSTVEEQSIGKTGSG